MLDRSHREAVAFEYEIELQGELFEQDRARLLDVARSRTCFTASQPHGDGLHLGVEL